MAFTRCAKKPKSAASSGSCKFRPNEVYGDVESGHSVESDPLAPRSPYAASKAGGELIARSYFISHGLPVVITRGSNTFGPFQFPEKLIPLMTTNALDGQPLPIYGATECSAAIGFTLWITRWEF